MTTHQAQVDAAREECKNNAADAYYGSKYSYLDLLDAIDRLAALASAPPKVSKEMIDNLVASRLALASAPPAPAASESLPDPRPDWFASRRVKAAPAASEPVAGYMPTYGQIPWQALIDAVSEAQIGKPGLWKPDEGCFVGHAPVIMNMNSLNRIVSKFAAPQPPAASSDEQDARPRTSSRG